MPDLKTFINSSELPSVHDLLGLTTTTTQVSYVNKPIFPLNLSFWSSNIMTWRVNTSTNKDYEDPSTENDDGSLSYMNENIHSSNRHNMESSSSSRFGNSFGGIAFSADKPHDVAQMVIPASVETIMQQYPTIFFPPYNISSSHQDSNWYPENFSSGSTLHVENGTELGFGSPQMTTAGTVITSVVLGTMILTTVIGER